jgi:hypothetical protein
LPNRLLKATANKSKKLNAVSDGAQALWFRLLTCLDDYGRFDAEPALVAAAAYPLRHNLGLAKVSAWLKELAAIGLIVIYNVNGDNYLYFTNWDQGNIRAKKSKFPEPDSICLHLQTNENNGKQKRSYSDTYSDTETYISCANAHSSAEPTPAPQIDDESETEQEEPHAPERSERPEKPSATPQAVVESYNAICTSLPRVEKLTDNRRKHLAPRIREHPDIDWWRRLFQRVQTTPFLRGNGRTGWRASFDWLIANDTNAIKVLEGKYDDAGGGGSGPGGNANRGYVPEPDREVSDKWK